MISTRYFDIPLGGVLIVQAMICMGKFSSGLCALIVPYKHSGMESDRYFSK